jgi:TonB family protein
MRRCKVCGEQFEALFGFCPIDGTQLGKAFSEAPHSEFTLTIVSDVGLIQRLAIELNFLIEQIEQAWPSFRDHPVDFTTNQLSQLRKWLWRTLGRQHVVSGLMTAILLVSAIVLSVLLLEKHSPRAIKEADTNEIADTVTIDFQDAPKPSSDSGVGAGEKGRVGFERGSGEGSRPIPARAKGGGGGGLHDQTSASQGRLPQPSVIPAPIPTTFARMPPVLPAAGLDIDPALWRNLNYASYGDPRAKSTTPSNGPGDGGGVGNGNRTGIGEGDGPGFGRGKNGNIGGGDKSHGGGGIGGAPGDNPNEADRVYSSPEVTTRARVLSKPEPQYTEEARRNQITGTVILRVVFSRSGEVTNIRAIQTLSDGLTEKAMAAARRIRFVPATRNGQTVSMYMQLEYNFNLY